MSPVHRDPEGRQKAAPTYPSLVERLIQEAIDRGEFDDLPGRGKPLRLDEDEHAGEWALGFRILKNANLAPRWIEADKEVRRLRVERDRLLERAAKASGLMQRHYRRQLQELVEAHNRAVDQVNAYAPSDRQHRRRMVLAEEIRVLSDRDAYAPS